MSLNRSEQMMCDYVEQNPEELRYWNDKVKATAAAEHDRHHAAGLLAEELLGYFEERAGVIASFGEMMASSGISPANLRNRAEYWLRLWAPPPPKKKRESWMN